MDGFLRRTNAAIMSTHKLEKIMWWLTVFRTIKLSFSPESEFDSFRLDQALTGLTC